MQKPKDFEKFPRTLKQFLNGEFGLPLDAERELIVTPSGKTEEKVENK